MMIGRVVNGIPKVFIDTESKKGLPLGELSDFMKKLGFKTAKDLRTPINER